MNLIRGSGVRGLSGMQMLSKDILRPLIDFSKEELQEYCHKKSVAFREDKTNSDTDIRRNYIRHKLIPGIEKVNKNFRELLHRKSFYFEEIDNLLTIMAFDFIKKNCLAEGKNISCNIAGFKKVAPAIQRAVIQTIYEMFHGSTKGLTFDQIEELIKTIYNDRTGTEKFLGDRLSLTIEYGKAIFQREIEKRERSLPDRILQIPVPGVITYTGGRIITRYKKELPKRKKKNSIYLSAKNKEIQIFMRRFQPGDRLNPYGMNGSKKIQDLFVDAKIPRSIRKDVPIITDENGKIMAVGKLRVDRSFHPQMIPGFIVEIEFREGDDK
jgi:tRNA(Ile)-lysidine synthase